MPKRAVTPPPPEDEPRYLTVAYPYPPHGNMELVQDCAELSRWIACIVGKDALLALFHKPSSPNMVIIEVQREFGDWNSLLGEHRWSEVFKKCAPADKDRVSQIFWCEFNTGRRVQKYGWKRVYVEEKWFAQWRVPNTNVTYPYPATHWCDVPREDKTNAPLCRPLPVAAFPPPPSQTVRPPPVGSVAWSAAKRAPVPKINPKSAWGRGPPADPRPPPSSSGSRVGSVWGGSRSSAAHSLSSGNGAPPGLPPLSTPYSSSSDSSAWDNTPGLASAGGSGSGSDDTNSDIIGRTPPASEAPEVFVAGDVEDDMAGLNINTCPLDGEDDDNDFIPVIPADAVQPEEPAIPEENLWADYDNHEPEHPVDEIICPAHGKLCSRGICKEYNRLKRALEREKEAQERAAAQQEKKKEKKSKARNPVPVSSNKISYSAPRPTVVANKIARTGSKSETQTPTSEATPGGTARARPPHLMKAASTQDKDAEGPATSPRPARGRKMNANPPPHPTTNVQPKVTPKGQTKAKAKAKAEDDSKSVASSASGWGNVSRGPWGGASVGAPSVADDRGDEDDDDDAQSVAASSVNGWGRVSRGPWGGASIGAPSEKDDREDEDDDSRTVNGSESGRKGKSWADQMDDEDNMSVAASEVSGTSGWGNISNGPW
ncbi:hypothetical protein BDY19DRAFT_938117 [Irpex rosettiformis]|uniref:Uncharacterized protein n=1 Tax=Irpex rosettiformis TaxID=378272 RepID=A0ACB8U9H5_9APHY|nr:hypothetical protein BDY19DRAFT_938117 [Irpex rosettiformis]